ncbi:MAG TPA: hypothetical protein VEW03_08125 [Longimicrobiaceae bacterium]|nr:hypothetical protein [Longimicrobiaceae bacterium]
MSTLAMNVPESVGAAGPFSPPGRALPTIGSNWAERTAEYARDYAVELSADEVVCIASALWLETVNDGRPKRLAGISPVAVEQLCAQLQWALIPYRSGCETMLYTICMRSWMGKRMLMKLDEAVLTGAHDLTRKPVYALADRVHHLGDLPKGTGPVLERKDEIEAELDFGGGVRRRLTLAEVLRVWQVDADELSCEWHMVLPCQPTAHAEGRRLLTRSALVRQFHLLRARYPGRVSGLPALARLRDALAVGGEEGVREHREMLLRSFPAHGGERADMGRRAFAEGVRSLAEGAFEGVSRAAERASRAWLALRDLSRADAISAAELEEAYEELQGRERVLLDALGRVAGGAA